MFYKLLWAIQGFILSLRLAKYGYPNYFAFPIFSKGLNRVYIGNRVRVFPGSRLETHFDGEIHIEDNVSIGQNFHITAASKLVIGKGTVILGNVFVTDLDHEYRNIERAVSEQEILKGKTIISENCFIGFGANIQAGTQLGSHCIVGCNSVVRGIFPDYSVIVGSPARIVKRYCKETNSWIRVSHDGK